MATKTAKKKSAKKRAPRKTATMGSTDAHPDQQQLDGMEEERISEIEAVVSSIVNNSTRIKEMQEQNKELTDELCGLMHEHDLTSYKCMGRVVSIIEGEEKIEIKKAKKSKAECSPVAVGGVARGNALTPAEPRTTEDRPPAAFLPFHPQAREVRKAMTQCRRCSECTTNSHHWMADPHDPEDLDDEDRELKGSYGCKHCEQRGESCPACPGDDEAEANCPCCHGEGVIPWEQLAEAVSTWVM